MKRITFLLASLFLIASVSSYAQTTKEKTNEDKTKTKTADEKTKAKDDKVKTKDASGTTNEKTKVKDNKIKSKDAAGNKVKMKAPAPVMKTFSTDYPDVTDATWSSSRGDWTATYKVNGMQTVTTYHANGTRVDTRTTYPLDQLPQAVVTYQQNNSGYTPTSVILISRPNQTDIYELKSSSGTIYIDANGAVTTYTPGK